MNKRLILYNIEYCEGMLGQWYNYLKFWRIFLPPKNLDLQIVSELKKLNPDILAIVEVDTGSFRTRGKDEAKFFEKHLGFKYLDEEVKYYNKGLGFAFRHLPIFSHQSNAIISRYKFSKITHNILSNGTKRVVIEVKYDKLNNLNLVLAHLALSKKTREKNINELIKIVKLLEGPIILMGDFNTFNGEQEIERLLIETGLKHKFSINNKGNTLTQPTFNPKRRLDYVLTSKDIKVNSYKVLNLEFSDHLPVMVDFEFKK